MSVDLSLIICTRNRSERLEEALMAVSRQAPEGKWELVVVDNGSTDGTSAVLDRWKQRLPIRSCVELAAGKSRALNRGLEAASGDLLVFTDDDVRPSEHWLASLSRAARQNPGADVFGGPIIPEFPAGTPAWMPMSSVAELAFAKLTPPLHKGVLPKATLPMGPNMSVRSAAAKGLTFRLDLGPSEEGCYMCEDSDFMLQLQERGHRIVFVPQASVVHCVRPEMTSIPYQLERGFQFGRSVFRMRRTLYQFGPTFAEPGGWTEISSRFQRSIRLNACLGQIYEAEISGEYMQSRTLSAMMCALEWTGDPSVLSRSASAWLEREPRMVPAPARASWLARLCTSERIQ